MKNIAQTVPQYLIKILCVMIIPLNLVSIDDTTVSESL